MRRAIISCLPIILSLVSCTAAANQTPTNAPVVSGIPSQTLAPTTTPTEIPEATQTAVNYQVRPLILKNQNELVDSRIGCLVSGVVRNPASEWSDWIKGLKADGFTRARFTLDFSDGPAVDLSYASIENELPDDYVALFRQMKDLGIKPRYSLSFWDMAFRQGGGQSNPNRLSTEAETDRYLAYVKMVVTRLRGLVDSYELWNEPDANRKFHQRITPEDYIRVAKLAIPLIREIDPQAKIVLVGTSNYIERVVQDYSMKVLQSDVMPLGDAISLHTVNNDASPVFHAQYYYGYDAMWKDIKQTAEAHGFHGEYIADELNYRSNYSLNTLQPEPGEEYHPYEPEVAAKYIGRMIVINRGLDISVGTSGTNAHARPIEGRMIRNLAYLLDGLQARSSPVAVQCESKLVRTYTFVDGDGNEYIAVWEDGEASVAGSATPCSIEVQGTSAISVTATDPFNSTTQQMKFTNMDSGLVLNGIDIRDYPVLYKVEIR